jgi:hypothetical protein
MSHKLLIGSDDNYRVSGKHHIRKHPVICYSIYPLRLTENDKHQMQMNSKFIPTPSISERFSTDISIAIGHAVV